jgi:hypothetical protein
MMNDKQTKMLRQMLTEYVDASFQRENEGSKGIMGSATAMVLVSEIVNPTPNISKDALMRSVLELLIGESAAKTALQYGFEWFRQSRVYDE